jgi:hypothetical protein
MLQIPISDTSNYVFFLTGKVTEKEMGFQGKPSGYSKDFFTVLNQPECVQIVFWLFDMKPFILHHVKKLSDNLQ